MWSSENEHHQYYDRHRLLFGVGGEREPQWNSTVTGQQTGFRSYRFDSNADDESDSDEMDG